MQCCYQHEPCETLEEFEHIVVESTVQLLWKYMRRYKMLNQTQGMLGMHEAGVLQSRVPEETLELPAQKAV